MLRINNLRVEKAGQTICQIGQLEVSRGSHLAILGANGSGKTTLLRVIGGLETDFSGEVATELSIRERVYVHQSPYLFRGSVLSNVTYGLRARHLGGAQSNQRARQWLKLLDVDRLEQRHTARLSAGERRRVALARALVLDPPLLLLDEPFAELDEQGIERVCEALSNISSTILMASPVAPPPQLEVRTVSLSP